MSPKKILPIALAASLALSAAVWSQMANMPGMSNAPAAGTSSAKLDGAAIEKLTGLKGAQDAKENVFKVSYPRSDLHVVSQGVTITPPMGLTCWVAFTPMGDHAMCMGDTVLTEDQVAPVMSAALDNGLEVTALHNHFFYDNPKVYFMHIGGMGKTETLATAVGKVYDTLKKTAADKPSAVNADIDPAKTSLDPKKINDIFGTSAALSSGVLKLSFAKPTSMAGTPIGNAMGANTWAAFVGSDDKAAVMGDFATTESELQNVLKTLRKHNISIVAIHNHMEGESPRIVFLHYWAIGKTTDLAKGVKAALDTQK